MSLSGTLSEPWVIRVRIQTELRVFFAYQCFLAAGASYLLDLETVRQAKPGSLSAIRNTCPVPSKSGCPPRSPVQPITEPSVATPPPHRLGAHPLLQRGHQRAGLRAIASPFRYRSRGRESGEAGQSVVEDRKVRTPAKGETEAAAT